MRTTDRIAPAFIRPLGNNDKFKLNVYLPKVGFSGQTSTRAWFQLAHMQYNVDRTLYRTIQKCAVAELAII